MKIAFVYPGIAHIGYGSWAAAIAAGTSDAECVYGLSLLAAVVAERGHAFELLDMRQLRCEEELKERLRRSDAQVVGISVQTPSFDIACRVAEIAKSLGKTTIGGGIHATVAPEEFEPLACWDHVVSGEGEKALPDLLDKLAASDGSAKMIAGSITEDLDQLPTPYLFPEWGAKYRTLYALEVARGCPGRCTYCVSGEKKFYQRMRFRSVDHVLREVEQAHARYKFTNLLFLDVNATTRRKHFHAILHELLRRHPDLGVIVQERSDGFDEETARLLSGFRSCQVWFGFESMSPRMLAIINKETNPDEARAAVALCRRFSLSVAANVLIGVPGETDDDIRQTYEFIAEIRPAVISCNILSPFPGTKVHDECVARGDLMDLDSHERYELRSVLERGIIRSIDYRKVRVWHRLFYWTVGLHRPAQPAPAGPRPRVATRLRRAATDRARALARGVHFLTRQLREPGPATASGNPERVRDWVRFGGLIARLAAAQLGRRTRAG